MKSINRYVVLSLTACLALVACGDDKKGLPGGDGSGAPNSTPSPEPAVQEASAGAGSGSAQKSNEDELNGKKLESFTYRTIDSDRGPATITGYDLTSIYGKALYLQRLLGREVFQTASFSSVYSRKDSKDEYTTTILYPAVKHAGREYLLTKDSDATGICRLFGFLSSVEGSTETSDSAWILSGKGSDLSDSSRKVALIDRQAKVKELRSAIEGTLVISKIICTLSVKDFDYVGFLKNNSNVEWTFKDRDGAEFAELKPLGKTISLVQEMIRESVSSQEGRRVDQIYFNSDSTISLQNPRVLFQNQLLPLSGDQPSSMLPYACQLFGLDADTSSVALPAVEEAVGESVLEVTSTDSAVSETKQARSKIKQLHCSIKNYEWVSK